MNSADKDKKIRILRLFVTETLRKYFQNYEYIPFFLPTLHYRGTGGFNMMHFAVLGTRTNPSADGSAPWYQTINKICNQKFVTINKQMFSTCGLKELNEQECSIKNIRNIRRSKVFQDHWKLSE